MSQAKAILSVLEQNGEGFLVARRLDGRWSVEVAGGVEHVGESITDALAQATMTLAFDKGIEPEDEPGHPDDVFHVEPPLEFCRHYVYGSDGMPSLVSDHAVHVQMAAAANE